MGIGGRGKRGIVNKSAPEKVETVLFPIFCLTWGAEPAGTDDFFCSLFSWSLLATLLGKPNYQFSQLSVGERVKRILLSFRTLIKIEIGSL